MSSLCLDVLRRGSLLLCVAAWPAAAQEAAEPLRVCADPDNFPQSHADGSGYEDRLAELLARALDRPLSMVRMPLKRGFVRKTLGEGHCDVLMGVPARFDPLTTTRPYLRSGYVFVTRAQEPAPLRAFDDPRLPQLRIGVQLPGDDGAATPPGHALVRRGAVAHVVGFTPYGESPAGQRMLGALQAGTLDAVLAWGPQVGPLAKRARVPLRWDYARATPDMQDLPFSFDIAVGVKKGQTALRDALQGALDAHRREVDALLDGAGVPRLPLETRP